MTEGLDNSTLSDLESTRPKRLGRYKVGGLLGRGGFGVVYRGVDPDSGKPVALKTVRRASVSLLRGVRQEIRTLAAIDHPGVVRILDSGHDQGLVWYAMDLLEGVTLGSYVPQPDKRSCRKETTVRLSSSSDPGWWTNISAEPVLRGRGGQLKASLAIRLTLVRRMAETLAYLHGKGIVHRDLKPDNVMVLPGNRPVLVDFGLVHRHGGGISRETLDLALGTVGTLSYMPPEQAMGRPVDGRADLYSLGCILYELVAGRPPFVAESAFRLIYMHQTAAPPPLHGVPRELGDLVSGMLEKKPRDRVGYAIDVVRDLAALGAEGGEVKPPTVVELHRPELMGRKDAIETLRDRIRRTRKGKGGILLLSGESGAGKTRLAMEGASIAFEEGLRILVGECLDKGDGFLNAWRRPLQTIVDLCEGEGPRFRSEVLTEDLPIVAPFIEGSGASCASATDKLAGDAGRLRLVTALLAILGRVARRYPLLVILDDVQWADDLSMGVLLQAARSGAASETPMLLICCYREEEVGEQLAALIERQDSDRIEIDPLDRNAVEGIIGDMLALRPVPKELSTFVARQSAGNPFYAAEYVRSLVEEGSLLRNAQGQWEPSSGDFTNLPMPGSVRDLVLRRFARLEPETIGFLEAAAVAGRVFDVDLLATVESLSEEEALDRVGDLIAAGIVESEAEGEWRFSHDKLREAAYSMMQDDRRLALHRLLAEGLARRAEPSRFRELADHYREGGRPEAAAGFYIEAARYAVTVFALSEAETCYRAALDCLPAADPRRIAAKAELAFEVLTATGCYDEARKLLQATVPKTTDPDLRAKMLVSLAAIETGQGRLSEAESLLSLASDQESAGMAASIATMRADILLERGATKEAAEELKRVLSLVEEETERCRIYSKLAESCKLSGAEQEGLDFARRALEIAKRTGQRSLECSALEAAGALLMEAGRFQEAVETLETAVRLAVKASLRVREASLRGNLGGAYYYLKRLDDCGRETETAARIFSEMGDRRNQAIALGNLANIEFQRGDRQEASATFSRVLSILREIGDLPTQGITLQNVAKARVAEGRYEEAEDALREAVEVNRKVGQSRREADALEGLAGVLVSLGRLAEAEKVALAAAKLYRQQANPSGETSAQLTWMRALRLRACAAGQGVTHDGLTQFEKAAASAPRSERPWFLSALLIEEGFLRLARGESAADLLSELASNRSVAGVDLGASLKLLRKAEAALQAGDTLAGGEPAHEMPTPLRRLFSKEEE